MYNELTNEEMMLVNTELSNDSKSTMVAIVLCLFFGGIGAHRFYLGKTGSGIVMAATFILGFLTTAIAIGYLFLAFCGLWALADVFLCSSMANKVNNKKKEELAARVLSRRRAGAVQPA